MLIALDPGMAELKRGPESWNGMEKPEDLKKGEWGVIKVVTGPANIGVVSGKAWMFNINSRSTNGNTSTPSAPSRITTN